MKLAQSFAAVSVCFLGLAAGAAAPVVMEKGLVGPGADVVLRSPRGTVEVHVGVTAAGRLAYALRADGKIVLAPSALGITVDGVDLGQGVKISGQPTLRQIDESYAILGNHAVARNHAAEAVIPLEASGKKFSLAVRAYDDGAAVRYVLPADAVRINGESTAWKLPENVGKVVWSEYSACYEGLSHFTPLAQVPEDKPVMAPLTVEVGGHYLGISEADCETFSDMTLLRQGNQFQAAFPFQPGGWLVTPDTTREPKAILRGTSGGVPVSPWRTTVIARTLTELVNSDLLTNLCPPPAAGADFSWVKPGRCLWQWWSVGAPKYADQQNWFDAAAKLKWEYYLIDDGWRNWKQPGRDQWELLKEVIDYGNRVGVKSIVWVNSNEMRNAAPRRAYLERIKACGAVGIKIDFIPKATGEIMQWYMGGIQDCADLKLLVNYHGSVKPTGLSRTYPHDITREAVRGDEYHMSRYKHVMPLSQDCTLPFARPLAGSADITPVMLDPKQLISSRFTWPHEMAQAIVFLSPVTHFADQYKFYVASPALDLFQELPTVWDETRVLECTEIGEVVAFARRNGDSWWIGVMNGGTAREIKIPLTFLAKETHGTLLFDHPETDAAIDRQEKSVKPSDVLTVKLRPAGGFFARLGTPVVPRKTTAP